MELLRMLDAVSLSDLRLSPGSRSCGSVWLVPATLNRPYMLLALELGVNYKGENSDHVDAEHGDEYTPVPRPTLHREVQYACACNVESSPVQEPFIAI